jgi:hypothetical protein
MKKSAEAIIQNQGNQGNPMNQGSDIVPSLRFPEFTNTWESNILGNIFEISAGGDISAENVSQIKNEIFKFLSMQMQKGKRALWLF